MTENLDKEVSEMCNISEGVYEKGLEKGIEKGEQATNIKTIKNAINKGLPYEMIAEIVSLPVEEVKELAKA